MHAAGARDEGWSERHRHRLHILESLLAICRQFERLQASGDARQACSEVAGILNAALIKEQINSRLRIE